MSTKDGACLSVIIPCFNEEENIATTVERVAQSVPEAEIIVVDDGSTDDTYEVVSNISNDNLRIVRYEKNKGKGKAIQVGIKEAKRDIMAQVDADSQFPPEELDQLIEPIIQDEADITFGSRFLAESRIQEGSLTPIKRVANFVVSSIVSIICLNVYTDIQAGFKAWKSDVIRDIDIQRNDFAYEPEIAIMADKKGYRIKEIPITYEPREAGDSKVDLWRDGVIIPIAMVKIKLIR